MYVSQAHDRCNLDKTRLTIDPRHRAERVFRVDRGYLALFSGTKFVYIYSKRKERFREEVGAR